MDVEAMLTQAISSIGGVHVRTIVGDSPDFDNADFLFRADNVIAELKCLDEDLVNDSEFIEKATAVHLEQQRLDITRQVPIVFGEAWVTTEGRSPEYIKAMRELYYEPIRRSIKKANKQIKTTAEKLGIEGPKGLVVIANNNHSVLEPWHAMELFKDAFNRETFSGVNSILYLSAGQRIEVMDESRHMDVIMECRAPNKPTLDRQFIKRFNQAWMQALATVRGSAKPSAVYEVGASWLPAIRNRPRNT